MAELRTDILIVGGGPAGMSSAVAASEASSLSVTVVDENPSLGGQIWRAELGTIKSSDAAKLARAVDSRRINIVNNAQVFAADEDSLAAERAGERIDLEYRKLIIATGARERFLPFPGWTLPGVFGAGGLQALAKGGLDVAGKRIVVAGTGPLLLAVADYLRSKGAHVLLIAEQTSAANIRRFARGLWRSPEKMVQAAAMRARLVGIPYHTDCWLMSVRPRVSKGSTPAALDAIVIKGGSRRSIDCDYIACGFHLVPNIELADLLGCTIDDGFVASNEFQRTSIDNIYCAGEPTGVGGVESSLIEGRIAGLAAAGLEDEARKLFAQRRRTQRFAAAIERTFALRSELKRLADETTVVCRCEDVTFAGLAAYSNAREAKLQTRCGMGACQGRVCGSATEFLFGWERGSVRPPLYPVKMENL